MKIGGLQKVSLIDYPEVICGVIFLQGCNFKCSYCHNPELVEPKLFGPCLEEKKVLKFLASRVGKLDAVTITGGEPTMHQDLPELLGLLRRFPVGIKLDTNGSNPGMLADLIRMRLVDAVFMDVKAPLTTDHYSKVAGVKVDVSQIQRSMDLLKVSPVQVTFRTTVVPGLVEEPELAGIRAALGDDRPFVIQAFRGVETLDPLLARREEFNPARVEAMRRQFETGGHAEADPTHYVYAGIA